MTDINLNHKLQIESFQTDYPNFIYMQANK